MEDNKGSFGGNLVADLDRSQSPEDICRFLMGNMDVSSLNNLKAYLEEKLREGGGDTPRYRLGDTVRVRNLTLYDRVTGNAYREGEVFVIRHITKDKQGVFNYRKIDSIFGIQESQLERVVCQ